MATTKKKPMQDTAVVEPAATLIPDTTPAVVEEAPVKKTTRKSAKKTAEAAPKATAKTATKETKSTRTCTRKTAATTQVTIELGDKSASSEALIARAKEDWEAKGHSVKDIKNLSVYVNASEGMVYYVVDDDYLSGSFAF